ncbi:hypothetical protein PMAYCL1PPCAC_24375, partial [Pristionchus mayeri]
PLPSYQLGTRMVNITLLPDFSDDESTFEIIDSFCSENEDTSISAKERSLPESSYVINNAVWDRLGKKLEKQKMDLIEAELSIIKNLMKCREGAFKEKTEELKKVHQSEIHEKEAEIDGLTRVNEE